MIQNNQRGILLMALAAFVFAVQDGISQHLARDANVFMVVMVRYWFFAALVIALSARNPGGLRAAAATKQPFAQICRGVLLAAEICVTVQAFVLIGLVETHAVFAMYPLIAAALSGPVLGEQVGWRRWSAIGVGFLGMLIILQPGSGVFSGYALIPLIGALMFALYGLLTRYVARQDTAATSFFWTGIAGAVISTLVGMWFWEQLSAVNWIWMAVLCVTGASGHFLLIKAYEQAEVSAVQPFAYLQLPFATMIGVWIFSESLRGGVVLGAVLIVAAGIFTLLRERRRE